MKSIIVNHIYVMKGERCKIFINKLNETPQEIKDFLHENKILTVKYQIENQYRIYKYWK